MVMVIATLRFIFMFTLDVSFKGLSPKNHLQEKC